MRNQHDALTRAQQHALHTLHAIGLADEADTLAAALNAHTARQHHYEFWELQRVFPYMKYRLLRLLERAGVEVPEAARTRSIIAGYCTLMLRDSTDAWALAELHCMLQVYQYACARGECVPQDAADNDAP